MVVRDLTAAYEKIEGFQRDRRNQHRHVYCYFVFLIAYRTVTDRHYRVHNFPLEEHFFFVKIAVYQGKKSAGSRVRHCK